MRLAFRYLVLAVALLLALPLSAQQEVVVPTEEEILSHTLNTSSPYYYTNLMLKYRSGAESLTAEEYYYLYYGYYFSDDYRPFVENRAFDDLMDVMSGLNPSQPTIGILELIVERGVLGDSTREQLYFNHLNGILGAIERSGTGLREESPKHIVMFSHAYDLLASQGYAYHEARIISRTVEYIPLTEKSADGTKGFYFDYSRIYSRKPDNVVFKRDRTWQINNLPPTQYK